MSLITAQHIETYRELGATRIEGAFSSAWVDQVTAVLDETISRARDGRLQRDAAPHPVFSPIEFEEHDGYVRLINVLPEVPRLQELLLASRAPEIVADVIGSETLRLWVDGTFQKEGSASQTATPWHNDECTYSLVGEHRPSLWIALTDVDEDNSPLTTLSGSNRDPWRYHSPFSPQGIPTPSGVLPWQHLVDRTVAPGADVRVWPARRGDAIALHPKTIHGSLERRTKSQGRRLGLSVRWLGDDVTWAPNELSLVAPFDRNELMQRGHPPPEALFPVVWRRNRGADSTLA